MILDGGHLSAQTRNAKQFGTLGVSSAAFTIVRIDGGERVIVLRFVGRSGSAFVLRGQSDASTISGQYWRFNGHR